MLAKLPCYKENEIQNSQRQQWKIVLPAISHTYSAQDYIRYIKTDNSITCSQIRQ